MSLGDVEKRLYEKEFKALKKEKLKKGEDDFKNRNEGVNYFGFKKKFEKFSQSEDRDKMPNWRKWLAWFAVVVFLVSAGVAGFYFVSSFRSEGVRVKLDFQEEKIYFGVPFKASVSVINSSGKLIDNSSVSIILPEGVFFAGERKDQRVLIKEMGKVESGSLVKKEFDLVADFSDKSDISVEAFLEYETGSVGSRFEEKDSKNLVIEDTAVFIEPKVPEKVFSGEEFEIGITAKKLFEDDLDGVKIKFEYPDKFNLVSLEGDFNEGGKEISPRADFEEEEYKVRGNIVAPFGSFFEMKAVVEREFLGVKYKVFETSKGFSVQSSPLSLDVFVNNSSDMTAKSGDFLKYTLVYENNTSVGLRDIIIKADLSGEMFDFSGILTEGSFNSSSKTISWNASINRGLFFLNAGTSGTVSFNIPVKKDYPISKVSDKNFTLLVEASIESPTVPEEIGALRTIGLNSLEIKVGGEIGIDTKVFYRDADSGIVNTGVWPPEVEKESQFTVHWLLTNYSTDVNDVVIKAFLAPGVSWTGNVKSNIASLPEYNERTQEVIWKMDKVSATKGIVSNPIEATFQIEAVPSSLLLNKYMPLIGKTSVSAKDSFTGMILNNEDSSVDSRLPDDKTISEDDGRVK